MTSLGSSSNTSRKITIRCVEFPSFWILSNNISFKNWSLWVQRSSFRSSRIRKLSLLDLTRQRILRFFSHCIWFILYKSAVLLATFWLVKCMRLLVVYLQHHLFTQRWVHLMRKDSNGLVCRISIHKRYYWGLEALGESFLACQRFCCGVQVLTKEWQVSLWSQVCEG
jgi:hypothetical protein